MGILKRLSTLNTVLRAIRNVNQLIVQEKDRKTLIKKACENFIKNRGFHSAWITLFDDDDDDDGKIINFAAEGGSIDISKPDEKFLRDYIPYCFKEALKSDDVVLIENVESDCKDCPWLKLHKEGEWGAMSVSLKSGGKCYGVINVSLPACYVIDKEERSLFMEVAGDIAFALSGMESEEKRKQVEEKMRKLSKTIEDAPVAIVISDLEGKIEYVNPGLLTLGGFDDDSEIVGKSFLKFTDEAGIKFLQQDVIPSLLSCKPWKYEISIKRKDGSVYPAEIISFIVQDENKQPKYMIGYFTDITERKQAETTLQESEEKYRLLAENTLDCIWKMDKEMRFTYINPSVYELFGFTPAEWVGSTLAEHCSKEEMQRIMSMIAEEMQKENYKTTLEMFLIHKDGREIPAEIRSRIIIDENKELIGLQGTTIDITQRKQAEEEIRQLSSAVEQSIDGVAICDLEAKLTYVNDAFARAHGYSPEEMIGMKGVDFVKKEDLDKFISSLNKIKTLGSWTGEMERIRKDGTSFPTFMSVNLLKDAEGMPTAVQAVVKDITEQKKLEEQFRQAQKMEAIGNLAGGVAHDFNNLLTIIIGNAQLALMNVIKDESLRKRIEDTMKAGERAASLTRQLLAFSRKQIITPRVLDFNKLLTGIEKMLARLIGEDVELLTILEPALWQVEVDPGQVEQVIMNLAVNAGDAMPRGGKLTIKTANIDLAENYFHEHGIKNEPGSYVMLTVSDTGSGMDKETREHIFEPFFTTKGVGKGTGLGLSTVYGIVKQNNGFVWVYSEPGQGSTFKVYLPRAEGDADLEEKQRTPVVELGGSETILIVEDDYGLRRFAQEVLLQHGYRVLAAENGEDALRVSQAHEGPIHLMITDVVMPKMGGKEAAERLQPFYPRMKVIYMSGYTDDAIIQHGVLAPGLNFLQKPFSPEGLAQKVREVLKIEN